MGFEHFLSIKACPDVNVQYHQHGSPVGSVDNVENWQSCGKSCEEATGCNYWTWWKNTGKCQFLTGKSPTKAVINAISGKSGCGRNSRNVHERLGKRSIGN